MMCFPKPWQHELWELAVKGTGPGVVFCNKDFVIVKDKYPKSTVHYLVVTREKRLEAIDRLEPGDESLLIRMRETGLRWMRENIPGIQNIPLKVGFHEIPSMQQIHLHMLSTDMITPTLPHLRHYNTCTTDYMRTVEHVINELVTTGKVIIPRYSRKMANALHANAACNRIGCGKNFSDSELLLSHLHECQHPLPGIWLEALPGCPSPGLTPEAEAEPEPLQFPTSFKIKKKKTRITM
eukprot:TRINITY_DN20930_c0_g1_i1.p1 TRINITY_DN20930_c0_g1~~TRINITY_DN20930_c0_g1_i1.p1  ORF type:complete len:238 (+),score=36.12 TRINITY_DN20930_c0_g1_i1:82-795(+)